MITMITGGARSGKSRYAAEQALLLSDRPVHVATARIWDDEFRARVDRHRSERGSAWECLEEEKTLGLLPLDGRVCVIDCVTLWLTNFFVDSTSDAGFCLDAFRAEVDALRGRPGTFFVVTNEIGLGVHADTEAGRKFTDLQGWANQYLASVADRVVLMVSGIPVTIKAPVV
ncbi:MAG TPA: bifunctional adenosylcobinamide kinase/adenosylcobinamide-phosphate guanylyltransferase [Dinghuibacter sp.]|jgi:adenosylcobinamide kinase/adenosylcobinamide-phosphate guanylyltransferase|uniref:bifunctional adenosylcobinamide kinase/adenosylcobinamide-phosphate guanylyltransferase n=1 Tax=Dinghuibacter sp. TaxID=2024697 RepID=UPI002BFCD2C5|nr:bifunctional adenosylcobinamide kinase/adenosylcobinamide-phosphate guanylyltransferase [Dinghuibacter sp.]HTJ11111.1 bifunctional adenosylcobinamide kinase/adenosylcobinamide-phosphate guanylyltransferase [Dinghuibacter sp.]